MSTEKQSVCKNHCKDYVSYRTRYRIMKELIKLHTKIAELEEKLNTPRIDRIRRFPDGFFNRN